MELRIEMAQLMTT